MVVDVNPFLIERLGFTREEFLGKKIWELGFFRDVFANQDSFKELQENEYIRYEDKPLRAADGHRIDVEFVSNVYLVNGKKVIQCNIRDITAHKREEMARLTNEALLSNAMKIARLSAWQYDVARDLFTFDDRFFTMLRTTAEREGGFAMSYAHFTGRFVHPDDRALVETEARLALEATDPGFTSQLEYRMNYADGDIGRFEVRTSIAKDKQGRTVKIYGVNRDITERRRTEEALRQEEALFASLANTMPDHIYFKDRQSRFIRINRAMARSFGLRDAEAAIGKTDFDIFGEDHARQAYADEQRIMETGEPMIGVEEKETWPDGRVTWVSTTKMPLREGQGRITGLVGVSRNTTRQKETEELLLLRSTALETAANSVVITDNNGLIEWVNSAFCALTGYTAAEAIGQEPSRLLRSGKHDDAFYERFWATLLAGDVWRGEMINRRKDGSLYTEFQTVTPVRDERGRVAHFVAIKEDTTAERAAEARIGYLNRIYSMLSAISQTIVRDQDPNEVFAEACKIAVEKGRFRMAWIATVDKQSNAIAIAAHAGTGENYLEHISKMVSSDASVAGPVIRALRAGAQMVCNDTGRDQTGEPWHKEALRLGYRAAASIPLHASGKVIGSLNLCADEADLFTEQEMGLLTEIAGELGHSVEIHEREKLRKESEIRIRDQAEVINQAPVAITITDLAGRLTYCNMACAHLFGFKKPEEMMGLRAEDIFEPNAAQVFAAARATTVATGSWAGETTFRTCDGRVVTTSHHMSLIYDGAGKPKARLSIAVDITEKKLFEGQALRAQRIENLGMLVAGIAHDFNNALAPIIMAGPLLRMQMKDPGALRMLDIVEQSSARGAALVRQMLSFAQGNVGEKRLVQVGFILREVADLAKSTFPKILRIKSHLPRDLWPIMSDPSQVHQVFLNLCVNARDAMPEGGDLTITAANRMIDSAEAAKIPDGRPGAFLVVEVRDTGTGIPPEVLERIWEPFFTTKDAGKGTGLGLSTVRSIIRQHDGFAAVTTFAKGNSCHGTIFTIYLPAVVLGTDGAKADTRDPLANRGNGELILLVDDEASVVEIGAKILTHYGYSVITAAEGTEAIAAFVPRASDVRLLLTDLDMPVMGGAVLALALRRLKPEMPVIAMSGAVTQADESYKRFATSCLPKPFDATTLLSVVRRTLDEAARAGGPLKE